MHACASVCVASGQFMQSTLKTLLGLSSEQFARHLLLTSGLAVQVAADEINLAATIVYDMC